MGRHYSFADVNTDEKPTISKCSRTFGDTTYTWRCVGRSSDGYGFTPAHSYQAWLKNWKRRLKFYGDREQWATRAVHTMTLRSVQRVTEAETLGRVCKYCGLDNLHWVETDRGWRLFDAEDHMHTCYPTTTKP